MQKAAKALTGKYAGERVYPNQSDLTHQTCQEWKLYCPICHQPIHFRESKTPCFVHYDYENKLCPERAPITGYGHTNSSSEAREQDREKFENFVRNVFYGIDPDYFNLLRLEGNENEFSEIDEATKWFHEAIGDTFKKWIIYYCKNTGFIEWNDLSKEVSYLIDWLDILSIHTEIAKHIIQYASHILNNSDMDLRSLRVKFGLPDKISRATQINCVALDILIDRFGDAANNRIVQEKLIHSDFKVHLKEKIPKNSRAISFRNAFTYDNSWHSIWMLSSIEIKVNYSKKYGTTGYIVLCRRVTEKQFYYDYDAENLFYYRELENNKPTHLAKVSMSGPIEILIDDQGNLAVEGEVLQCHQNSIIKGISKVLLNRCNYSIFSLLTHKFISLGIAKKAAQLALIQEYPDLEEAEAWEKFQQLYNQKKYKR